jgi:hypothetical protein
MTLSLRLTLAGLLVALAMVAWIIWLPGARHDLGVCSIGYLDSLRIVPTPALAPQTVAWIERTDGAIVSPEPGTYLYRDDQIHIIDATQVDVRYVAFGRDRFRQIQRTFVPPDVRGAAEANHHVIVLEGDFVGCVTGSPGPIRVLSRLPELLLHPRSNATKSEATDWE